MVFLIASYDGSFISPKGNRELVVTKEISSWRYLNGSMPHGSILGPVSFLVIIDELVPGCPTNKYVDNTTITEIFNSVNSPSDMSNFLHTTNIWAPKNDMQINAKKTKELVIGPWDQHNHTRLETDRGSIERVHGHISRLDSYLD